MREESEVFSDRRIQLNTLTDFIHEKYEQLSEIANKIGWTVDSLANQDKVQCRYDPGHWVKRCSIAKHEVICSVIKKGYTREELAKDPPSSKFFYTRSDAVVPIIIDEEHLREIISEASSSSEYQPDLFKNLKDGKSPSLPETMERYCAEFTTDERLAIYDYVVKKGKADANLSGIGAEDLFLDFEKKEEGEKEKSYLDLLAEQRDYKRRRQSYRAKNVHITKKSYTEVMKEVIENQISYLKERNMEEREPHVSDQIRDHRQEETAASQSHIEQRYKRDDEPEDSRFRRYRDCEPSLDREYKNHQRRKRSRSRSPPRHHSKHKKHKKHKSHHKRHSEDR